MDGLHSTTESIIAWSKRAALAAKRDRLTIDDILLGLYAVTTVEPGAEDAKCELVRVGAVGPWPAEIHARFEEAQRVELPQTSLPLDGPLKQVIDRTYAADPSMAPASLIPALFQERHALVAKLLNKPEQASPPGLFTRLDEIARQTEKLTARLRQEVLGQDAAIAMLGEAYYRAHLGLGAAGPKGIFTFMGPSGVGKTLLAEVFASALKDVDGGAYAFRRFDMGSFSGHQSHEQLFGAAGFYAGASPGTLTGFVHENPRAVILFDEIEKAHDNTLQALLAVLDKGEVEDKKLAAAVSFREAWLIFTSNLGREFFDRPNESGFLSATGRPTAALFEILGSSRRWSDAADEKGRAALSPEFVSRLAKGGAVLFSQLDTRHLRDLVGFTLSRRLEAARAQSGVPLPHVAVSDDAGFLFLLSLLPNVDARQVVARSEQWLGDLIQRSHEDLHRALEAAPPATYRVQVECGPDAQSFLAEKLDAVSPCVLLIDDDDYLPDVIRKRCADLHPEIRRAADLPGVEDALRRDAIDIVLLDLTIGQPAGGTDVERGLSLLEAVRRLRPDLPVYLFSENPEDRHAFEEVARRVLKRGGARGFLALTRRDGNPLALELFGDRVGEILREVRLDRVMRGKRRAHKNVATETAFRWEPETATVVAELRRPTSRVVVRADDQASPIRFSGIPSDRFADVVGLRRAKRRLAEALGWLKDPSRLARFHTSPPRGFLLAGPPGTGKTLLARALAGEAGLPFLALSAGELQSKWIGESEERIRELFERAREYAPAIVFIDEIDALAARRTGEHHPHYTSVLNQLLACLDGFVSSARPIFVLAATNIPEALDPALRRPGRFDEIIPVDLPNAAARRALFELRLARLRPAGPVDLDRLVRATAGLSPAALDRIVREAVYAAAAANRDAVTGDDLDRAARLVRFGAADEEIVVREEDRRLTAFHEAAHALAFRALFPGRRIDLLTIIPGEQKALGFLAMEQDETRTSMTADDVRSHLAVALAGREGERLAVGADGAITTGAASDLEQATALAWRAVTRWGFDPEFGPLAAEALGSAAIAGVGLGPLAQERVRAWLAEAQRRAAEVVAARRPDVARVAERLLKSETMDEEEFSRLLPQG